MRSEYVIPGLPCRDLDDVLPFYEALGFDVTYRQVRPNPYAAVRRGGIELHFFGVPEFNPEDSMGSVVVIVPDTGALYAAFAAGLRAEYGKVPISGIPRITRPRKKQGTSAGFSVVDPGGNWLRVTATPDEDAQDPTDGGRLGRVVAAAARQADSHGDVDAGVRVLRTGLARHADAPMVEQVPALVYLAELLVRTGDATGARESLALVRAVDLTEAERDLLATDLSTAADLLASELPD
ncbi:bleomycin resistance protein [Occultella gossypii]|uniref:VOC family protein n=1 Tax=Occultella gossypii TaxID=2800820 RepID=A0ABS7S5K2_9MICO|nr:VOC family protein [Occultella gossypii]MBZ2194904.1 VOC family protein [Occultella gossypii]